MKGTGAASRRRRALLTAGVATAAALAGGGLAWRQSVPAGPQPGGTAEDALQALWKGRFRRPMGGELAMADLRGRPVLLNFWATWCPPCVEELPLLDRFAGAQAGAGWQVVGLAVDRQEPVLHFLRGAPVSFPTALAGDGGIALARGLGNAAGGLPFTLVLNRAGSVHARKIGAVLASELADWVAALG